MASTEVSTSIKPYIDGREVAGQNKNLDLWDKWYKGYDQKFHEYKVYTTSKQCLNRTKKHLPVSKVICESWANLLVNEKTDVQMGKGDKELLDTIFERSKFWKKENKLVDKSFGLGLGANVVRIKGMKLIEGENGEMTLDENDKSGRTYVETVHAKRITPITYENGEITECAFATSNTQNSYITVHLKEKLNPDDETNDSFEYVILTLNYSGDDFSHLDSVTRFHTGSDIPWFSFIYPNVANNDDLDSDVGVSVYANVIDQFKAIDNKYDLFDHEFKQGRKRTYISADLQSYDTNGDLVDTFEGADEDYLVIPKGQDGKTLIQQDESDLRTEQYVSALNSELANIGYLVGFGKGFLSFSAEGGMGRPLTTATAVMMMNADLMRAVHKHEIVIEESLTSLVKAIIYATNTFTDEHFSDNAGDKIEIHFDDSIFEDKEAEKNTARTDVQNGIMSPLEYRMKFYSEDEKTALNELNSNAQYIGNKINTLLAPLQQKLITPDDFVTLVWGKSDNAKAQEIAKALEESQVTADDVMNNGANDNNKGE